MIELTVLEFILVVIASMILGGVIVAEIAKGTIKRGELT